MDDFRILVTGDTGFLGSLVMPLLQESSLLVVGLRAAMPMENLLNPAVQSKILEQLHPDHILHLAWTASSTPGYRTSPIHQRWRQATLNLVAEADSRGIGITLAGSVAEITPQDHSPYATQRQLLWSDLAAEVIQHNLGWLRIHYAIDPIAGHPVLVEQLMKARQRQSDPMLLKNPEARHDFVCATDVAHALALAALHKTSGLIEVGSGQTHSVEDLAIALGALYERQHLPSDDGFSTPAADTSRLRGLGWKPEDTLDFFT